MAPGLTTLVLFCHVGSQLSFRIIAKDSRGKRIPEGGSYITARLLPGSSARAAGAEAVVAEVIDNRDGSYIARYTVPVRGDWEVCTFLGLAFPERLYSQKKLKRTGHA